MAKYVPSNENFYFEFDTRYTSPEGDGLGFKFKTVRYAPPAGDKLGFNFTEAYIPSGDSNFAFRFGAEPYKAPQGNRVAFDLLSAEYVAPAGNRVSFNLVRDEGTAGPPARDTQYSYPDSVAAGEFGDTASVRHQYRVLNVYGASSVLVGSPTIYNYTQYLRPSGFRHSGIGHPTTVNKNQTIALAGAIKPVGFGALDASLFVRTIDLGYRGIVSKLALGALNIIERNQRVYASWIAASSRFGYQKVFNSDQHIRAAAISSLVAYGRPRVESAVRILYPAGIIVSSVVGQHTIRDRAQWVFANSISPLDAGIYLVKIENKNKEVRANGVVSNNYGTAEVVLHNQHVYIGSYIYSGCYGVGKVENHTRELLLGGIAPALVFGTHVASLYSRWITGVSVYGSVPATIIGGATIADRAFYPKIKSIAPPPFGTLDVGHEVRYLHMSGFRSDVHGRPRVINEKEALYPAFIYSLAIGNAWVSDGAREIRPAGRPSEERVAGGHTFVARSIRAVIVQGVNSEAFSLYAVIKDARMFVAPFSLPVSSRVYGGKIELWVRTVTVGRWHDTQEPTTQYGLTTVGLRDRTLRPSAVNQWRIGVGVTVYQFVADLDSVGAGLQLGFGPALISHGIHYLELEGLPPSGFGRYKRIHNAAFAITDVTLTEIQKHSFLAQVRNQNRYFAVPPITMVDSESTFGTMFIADRARAFTPFGIRSTQYVPQVHWVSYLHRVLKVGGITAPDISGKRETEVYERFNIVRTFWMHVRDTSWGYAVVVNRNRSVRPYGYNYTEFGRTTFEHFIRIVYVGAIQTQGIPRPRIADRKQSVDMSRFSLAYSVVNNGARVRNLLPDPPWTREINISSILKPWDEFGGARFKLMTVAGAGVEVSSSVGQPVLTRNTIEVRTGIVNYAWGMSTVAGPQYLNIRTISTPAGEQVPQGARFTPFNIYAPSGEETPQGYRPLQPLDPHVIDGRKYFIPGTSTYDTTKDRGGWVPRPRVEYRHRVVETRGRIDSYISMSHQARLAYIPIMSQYIGPGGWRQSRVGWMMFLPFTIEVVGRGFNALSLGRPSLTELPVWEREVKPSGFNVRRFGDTWVAYYNRYLGTKGRDTSTYGRPIIWFRVRGVQVQSGIAPTNKISELNWVSNYIRTVETRGWSAFNPQTAFEELETSVVNQYTGDVINAQSLVPGAVGLADVDRYTKYVSPRGLFPVPPLRPTVKSRTTLQAQGTESLVFGQVRKFEEGVVYPHEFDVGVVGTVVVNMPRQVQGFDSSMVNYPTIAAHAGATGVTSEEFGITVLKNEICCGGCG